MKRRLMREGFVALLLALLLCLEGCGKPAARYFSYLDAPFCAELAGEDRAAVHRTFELLCDEGVPPYQLFDIISDAKRESVERNLR